MEEQWPANSFSPLRARRARENADLLPLVMMVDYLMIDSDCCVLFSTISLTTGSHPCTLRAGAALLTLGPSAICRGEWG